MQGNTTLSFAGQQVVTSSRNLNQSPFRSQDNVKMLIQNGESEEYLSQGRFKQRQPLSYNDYYYSQNPTSKGDYAKMLDAQIEQKKQYQNIQSGHQRNERNLGKVNNINPHLIPEPQVAPNYGFQTALKTQQSNFGLNTQMNVQGTNYDVAFNPNKELERTQNLGMNPFQQSRQIGYQQNQSLKLITSQSQNAFMPFKQSSNQFNQLPFLANQNSYNQPSLLNSMQMQQALQGGTMSKKTVNFNMSQQQLAQQNIANNLIGQRQPPKTEENQEYFFDKWRNVQGESQYNRGQNNRGILKKENISEYQLQEKERKQMELNQALQEQIIFKKKRKEMEDRQRKLEDLVFAEKLRAEYRGERSSSQLPSSSKENVKLNAVAAQADRLQQMNLATRRGNQQYNNKQSFDDAKELPRTPPGMSQRNSIQEGPMVRIEKIIDFSQNRQKAPSPTNRRQSQGVLPKQEQILAEVKDAAELDMEYIKDYYDFQKKVFNRNMASLQKEVSGVHDQRTQIFKDMLLLREKSKQEHLMNLMKPTDVLTDNKYVLAQRKQNLYHFHQLEDMKNLYGGGNPYLQGIQYLPTNGYNFQNNYNDKQFPLLMSQSALIPPAELVQKKGNKKRGTQDNYDQSEQIIGDMKRKFDQYDKFKSRKPLSAGSRYQGQQKGDSFIADLAKQKGIDVNKKQKKNYKRNSVENEFLEDNDAFDESMGGASYDNNEKYKRSYSSQNYEEGKVDIQQFRKEMFPNKKLLFERYKDEQKEQQSYIEQYLWDKMSQNSEDRDELDEQIDEQMSDIEKMVNKEAINIPERTEDKNLTEIEMQRKMKAFLRGKELQEQHLQILLREQAKEKIRQIERESELFHYQNNSPNKEGINQPKTSQSLVLSYVSNANQKQQNANKPPSVNVIKTNDNNDDENENENNQNEEQSQEDKQSKNKINDDEEEEQEEEQEQEQDENDDQDEEEQANNQAKSRDIVVSYNSDKKPNKLLKNDIGKIQETDESGVSDKYDEKYNATVSDQIKIDENDDNYNTNTQQDQFDSQKIQQTGKKVADQDRLQELYSQIIQKNSKNFDSNLFEQSLNNIDDMLLFFKEPYNQNKTNQ